jgi:hypothetical protein
MSAMSQGQNETTKDSPAKVPQDQEELKEVDTCIVRADQHHEYLSLLQKAKTFLPRLKPSYHDDTEACIKAAEDDFSWNLSYPNAEPLLHPCRIQDNYPGPHFARGSHFLHPTYAIRQPGGPQLISELSGARQHPTMAKPLDPAVLDHYVPPSHYYFLHAHNNPDLCNCLVVRRPGHELSRELAVWSQSQALQNLKFLHARGGRWIFALEVCRRQSKIFWETFDWWDLRGILRVPAHDIERLILPKVPQTHRAAFCVTFNFHPPAFGVLEYCFQPLKHRATMGDLMNKPPASPRGAGNQAKRASSPKEMGTAEEQEVQGSQKENVPVCTCSKPRSSLYVFEDLGQQYSGLSPQEDASQSEAKRSHKAFVVEANSLQTQVAPLNRVSFPQGPAWTD